MTIRIAAAAAGFLVLAATSASAGMMERSHSGTGLRSGDAYGQAYGYAGTERPMTQRMNRPAAMMPSTGLGANTEAAVRIQDSFTQDPNRN